MERVDIKIKMTNNIYTNLGRGRGPKYLILCNRTLKMIMLLIKIDHIAINYQTGPASSSDNIEN